MRALFYNPAKPDSVPNKTGRCLEKVGDYIKVKSRPYADANAAWIATKDKRARTDIMPRVPAIVYWAKTSKLPYGHVAYWDGGALYSWGESDRPVRPETIPAVEKRLGKISGYSSWLGSVQQVADYTLSVGDSLDAYFGTSHLVVTVKEKL